MRVLVTGATGFIGRHLVNRLVKSGCRVIALARETSTESHRKSLPVEQPLANIDVVHGDLRNFSLTARAVRDAAPECVIHLAAAGVSHPFLSTNEALRHNVSGTLHLVRACFEAGRTRRPPAKLIVARTPGELTAMNVYAASKAAAWTFCQMYARTQEWPILGAMIFQAYGPGQPDHMLVPSAMNAALADEEFPTTVGAQQRDWIYVDDVISGLMAVLETDLPPGTTFELGTGQGTSVAEVVRQIFHMVGSGRPLLGVLPDRPGEGVRQIANTAQTYELIRWRATVTLAEGLHRLHTLLSA